MDGLRALLPASYPSVLGFDPDFAAVTAVTAALVAIAARLYPRLIQ